MQVPPADNVVYTHCKVPPICVAPCTGRMYFVLPKSTDTTRACVHLGSHSHSVSKGIDRGSQEDAKATVEVQIMQNPRSNLSTVLLKTARSLVQAMVLTKEGSSDPFEDDSLKEVIQHLAPLSNPVIRTHIKSLRASVGRGSLESNILDLKCKSRYNFIHGLSFLGQGCVKSWLFKMSTTGRGSGVDLVRRMQPGGDLERSWIIFDHVKRVKEWTTMAAHVYDPEFCKVMTIAICDLKTVGCRFPGYILGGFAGTDEGRQNASCHVCGLDGRCSHAQTSTSSGGSSEKIRMLPSLEKRELAHSTGPRVFIDTLAITFARTNNPCT